PTEQCPRSAPDYLSLRCKTPSPRGRGATLRASRLAFAVETNLRRDRVPSNCRQELPASQLASPACLETNPAMRVFARMSLTLVTADFAGASACLQQRPGDVRVVLRLPADDLEGGITHIGAVQTQAHALDQPGQVLLAQVSVSVGGARFEAVVE